MRIVSSLIVGLLVVSSVGYGYLKHLEAGSADELLEKMRRIRPHANQAEVEKILGPPDYTLATDQFPGWVESSAIGGVTDGTVQVYLIKLYHPKLLMIHLLPESGVHFVTWVPT